MSFPAGCHTKYFWLLLSSATKLSDINHSVRVWITNSESQILNNKFWVISLSQIRVTNRSNHVVTSPEIPEAPRCKNWNLFSSATKVWYIDWVISLTHKSESFVWVSLLSLLSHYSDSDSDSAFWQILAPNSNQQNMRFSCDLYTTSSTNLSTINETI